MFNLCIFSLFFLSVPEPCPKIKGVSINSPVNQVLLAFGTPTSDKLIHEDARVYRKLEYQDFVFFFIDCAESQSCTVMQIGILSTKVTLENGLKLGLSKETVYSILGDETSTKNDNTYVFWVGKFHGYQISFKNGVVHKLIIINEFG